MLVITTHSDKETQIFGENLASCLTQGDVIALIGGLGAGKTTLVKGIVRGLGCKEEITSPTFILLREYKARLQVYHFDFYRLEKPEALYDLDYEEYFYGQGVSIIEWAERAQGFLPIEYLRIEINWISQTIRELNLIPFGEHYVQMVKLFKGKKIRTVY